MNIALGTIILFLLFTPGITFRAAFNFGPLTKKYSKTSAIDDFIWALIPGAVIQLGAAYILNTFHWWGYSIDFVSLGEVLLATEKALETFKVIEDKLGEIILYNCALILSGALLGWGLRALIRITKLDRKWKAVRFNNEWWYILRGEFIDFKKFKKLGIKSIADCYIDCLVKVDNVYYIYTGYIDTFYLTKDGGLESIVLTEVERAIFPVKAAYKFEEIDSHLFVLKYSEIINLNVRVVGPLRAT